MISVLTRDDAILWVHEAVGHRLGGDASLADCIAWIQRHGTSLTIHELRFHILPLLEERNDKN